MKKFFKEFKKFVSRGNVMELAVGMIIGAAFTAIISAIVNGILKPLINLIPISDTGLQTVLREAVVKDGKVVTEALILDWGGVISAIITFFLTALLLFFIIRAFNKAQSGVKKVKKGYAALEKSEVKALKKQGLGRAEIKAIDAEKAAAKAQAEKEAAEAEANKLTRTEALLTEILELLKKREALPDETAEEEAEEASPEQEGEESPAQAEEKQEEEK